jgi:hypothetical protein
MAYFITTNEIAKLPRTKIRLTLKKSIHFNHSKITHTELENS